MNLREQLVMSSPVLGTWAIESDKLEGLWIFSETHYCGFIVDKDRKRFQTDQPSLADKSEAFDSLKAGAGTYSISGSTLTNYAEYDRVPGSGIHTWEFVRNGDNLSMHSVRPDGTIGLELELTKVE